MKLCAFQFTFFFLVCTVMSQPAAKKPMALDDLIEFLAASDIVKVSELTKVVQDNGISFDMGDQQLGTILAAAATGKRDPNEVAVLINACFQACQNCRARSIAPLTKEELRTLITWGFEPDAIFKEAKARGVKDVEISEASAKELKELGVKDDLIALLVPDDKLPAIPLEGYKAVLLNPERYDPAAPEGSLKVTTEIPPRGQSEFVFKHTALFVRAVNGAEPKVLSSYFNKPAPRNTPLPLVHVEADLENSDQAGHGTNSWKKGEVGIKSAYLQPDANGRNAFKILISNTKGKSVRCSFYIHWRLLTKPETPAPGPKQ